MRVSILPEGISQPIGALNVRYGSDSYRQIRKLRRYYLKGYVTRKTKTRERLRHKKPLTKRKQSRTAL
jgi:hypothetical protein